MGSPAMSVVTTRATSHCWDPNQQTVPLLQVVEPHAFIHGFVHPATYPHHTTTCRRHLASLMQLHWDVHTVATPAHWRLQEWLQLPAPAGGQEGAGGGGTAGGDGSWLLQDVQGAACCTWRRTGGATFPGAGCGCRRSTAWPTASRQVTISPGSANECCRGIKRVRPVQALLSSVLHLSCNHCSRHVWMWCPTPRITLNNSPPSPGHVPLASAAAVGVPRPPLHVQVSLVMAGGDLPNALGMPLHQYALSLHGPNSLVITVDPANPSLPPIESIRPCDGSLAATLHTALHVITVDVAAPPTSFARVACPTNTGFQVHAYLGWCSTHASLPTTGSGHTAGGVWGPASSGLQVEVVCGRVCSHQQAYTFCWPCCADPALCCAVCCTHPPTHPPRLTLLSLVWPPQGCGCGGGSSPSAPPRPPPWT